MLRLHCRTLLAAAAATGGSIPYSSASFTGDDDGAYDSQQREREDLQQKHSSSSSHASFSSSSFTGVGGSSSSDEVPPLYMDESARPTIHTYRSMSDEELVTLLRTREKQIRQLRVIYENFHYQVDKIYRKTIFEYHDKALQLSQVHGKMQQNSLETSRVVLRSMREHQYRLDRDKRVMVTGMVLSTLLFWVWVRRHYVRKVDLDSDTVANMRRDMVTGPGNASDNIFSKYSRSARARETSWEKEVRLRRAAMAEDNKAALKEKQDAMSDG